MIYFLAFYGLCVAIAGLELWTVSRPNDAEPDFSDWTLIPANSAAPRPEKSPRTKPTRLPQVAVSTARQPTAVNDGLVAGERV